LVETKKTGLSVPAATVRFVEYVVADSLRDTCRLKAAFRAAKNGWKLDYKYTGGYSTEQEALGEADLFSYAVQKDLARHWVPFNQRSSCSDLSKHVQYSDEFTDSTLSRPTPASKRLVSIVSPPTIPLNAAQTSQFKKLKKSSCPTLSQNDYLQAATSSNDVYDRFLRKLRRFRNTGVNFNKTESNRRTYLKRRELVMTERVENCLQTLKTLSKRVMDGTS